MKQTLSETGISEAVQKLAVKVLSLHPAGEGMCLIGGFRYRLLDDSCRRSMDIDYHWAGNLEEKQKEVANLFRRKLLPLIRQQLNCDGSVHASDNPPDDSPGVKTVEIAVWQTKGPLGRITVPVDITRIPCADKPVVRTQDGVVFLSASDADMVESKIVAIMARRHLEDRDIVDLFLFQDKLRIDSDKRLRQKFALLHLTRARILQVTKSLVADRDYHVRNIKGIMETQMDRTAATNITKAGGASMILDRVTEILAGVCGARKAATR